MFFNFALEKFRPCVHRWQIVERHFNKIWNDSIGPPRISKFVHFQCPPKMFKNPQTNVTWGSDYRWDLNWETRFIDHFNTWLVTTFNCSAIANLHTLQTTTANAKPSQSVTVSTRHSLVTTSNSGDSSASELTLLPAGSQLHRLSSLHRLPYNWLTSKLVWIITSLQGPHTKHCFQQFLYCCTWNRCCGNLLCSRYLVTDLYTTIIFCLFLENHSS
jgi:hypothetical protein